MSNFTIPKRLMYGPRLQPTFEGPPGQQRNAVNDPTDIPDLVLWLDGSDVSTLFNVAGAQPFGNGAGVLTTDGQQVASWADKSGQNHHMNQGNSNTEPTYKTGIQNGLSVVRSIDDVVDDFLYATQSVLTQTTNVTMFWVASDTGTTGLPGTVYSNVDADLGSGRLQAYVDTRLIGTPPRAGGFMDGTDSASPALLQAVLADTFHQYAIRRTGNIVQAWFDGVEQTSADATDVGAMTNDYTRIFNNFGENLKLYGDLGELTVYDAAISDRNVTWFNTWQKDKWATP